MHPRLLIALLLVAFPMGACAVDAADPPSTSQPSHVAVTSPAAAASPAPAVGSPEASASATPSATPSPAPVTALTGDVPVTMSDAMRFEPDRITVKAGVPITFIVRNVGVIVHEFVVGTQSEQEEHAAEMATGHMGHGHGNVISVAPGGAGSLTMTFTKAGTMVIGCHEPGHYDAGMKARLIVVD